MSEMKQELVMETTHGRKSKCKTEFKAVMNKVLVSGLILATLMGSTIMPAYASYADDIRSQAFGNGSSAITQTYGISVEQSISNIKNTIKAINDMKAKGQVSDAQIKELASQIYSLQQATMGSSLSDSELSDIKDILDSAEQSVQGLANQGEVLIASAVVRTMLGIEGGATSVTKKEEKKETESNIFRPAMDGTVRIPREEVGSTVDTHTANNNYAAGSTDGQVKGTQLVNSFWDVKPTDWYYTQVQAMVQRGLFAGKGNVSEGVGTFAPNDTMTKAEFITVVARMFHKDDELNGYSNNDSVWWDKYYNACVEDGIIKETEFLYGDMETGMTREQMALVAERALDVLGGKENVNYMQSLAPHVIPDYDNVSSYLRTWVVKAYADGLICGTDAKGTFAPKDTLTRAEASTVLYRIVESNARTPNKVLGQTINGNGSSGETQLYTSPITIYEGQKRENRPAKEGDTFIRANGEKVVLKKGPNGILGEGQKVAPDIGLSMGLDICEAGEKFSYAPSRYGSWLDSTGSDFNNDTYYVNYTTGEGHWSAEWQVLEKAYPRPTYKGTNGEVSKDPHHLYVWSDTAEWWVNNF